MADSWNLSENLILLCLAIRKGTLLEFSLRILFFTLATVLIVIVVPQFLIRKKQGLSFILIV